MVYSKANTAGICRPGFTVLVFLASNNNNNSNDDCQQQQQQQTSVPECDRPLFPFANLLASFECHFCPCGLRHFNFNLMQATNKQIKRPNAPYEYESWNKVQEMGWGGEVKVRRQPNLQVKRQLPAHLHRKAIFISRQDKCHNRITGNPRSAVENYEKSYQLFSLTLLSKFSNCIVKRGVALRHSQWGS